MIINKNNNKVINVLQFKIKKDKYFYKIVYNEKILFYWYFLSFIQYVHNRTISIKFNDIPDELIERFDTTTSIIKEDSQKYMRGCSLTIFTYL